MKNKHIGFGVFVLSIGIVLLLVNMGIINWSIMDTLFEFWPVIFIVIGINVIFRNNEIVKAITWLLFLAALISYSYFYGAGLDNSKIQRVNNVKIEKSIDTKVGNLYLALGGTRFSLASTDENLVEADIPNSYIKQSIDYTDGKKTADLRFEREHYINFGIDNKREDCKFSLNESMLWNLDIDTGAVNGTIDMSKLKIEKVDIDTGAANFKLIFGDKNKSVNVKINAGASKFDIVIPENVGVSIKMDGGLNNTNLKRLNWNKNGNYFESPNYKSAQSRIDFNVNMGVGNFMVDIQK